MTNEPARIGLVGGAWRASAFLRIAAARPESFTITSALVRSESSAESLRTGWGIPAATSVAEFLKSGPFDYVILAVPATIVPDFIRDFLQRGIPVLTETPLSRELPVLHELYAALGADSPVQVAEQYQFQPHHAARISVAASGALGRITSTNVSAAHEYHGMSLLRSLLGIGHDRVEVAASSFDDIVVSPFGRAGWPESLTPQPSQRVTARLSFPDRGALGVYEFNAEQYHSPIRSRHTSVSGELGEIVDDTVRYIRGPGDVVELDLVRRQSGVDGDLEGYFLHGLSLGERTVYENPLAPGRLADDEIAIGTAMLRMNAFVDGGAPFYGVADASQDSYLALLIAEAVRTGAPVLSAPQPWSSAPSLTVR